MHFLGIDWVGVNPDSGRKLLLSIAFVVVIMILSRTVRAVMGLTLGRTNAAHVQARFWGRQIVSLIGAIILILGLLSIWFNDPTRLATAFGLVSAGLAFALQQVVTSIAGYFVILRGSTFTVGDRISMGGVRGDVLRLGFIQTTIMEMGQPPSVQGADPAMWVKSRQFTGRIVTVANAKVFSEPVYNYTRDFPFIWEEMALPITYQADRERAEAILLDAARLHAVDPDGMAPGNQGAPPTTLRCGPRRPPSARVLPHHRQLARADGPLHPGHAPDPRREGRDEPSHTGGAGPRRDRDRIGYLRHSRVPADRDASHRRSPEDGRPRPGPRSGGRGQLKRAKPSGK